MSSVSHRNSIARFFEPLHVYTTWFTSSPCSNVRFHHRRASAGKQAQTNKHVHACRDNTLLPIQTRHLVLQSLCSLHNSPDGRRNTSTVCPVVCHNLHALLFQRCAVANIFDVNVISRADLQTVYGRAFCAAAKLLSTYYPLPHHPLYPLLFLYNFTLNHVIPIYTQHLSGLFPFPSFYTMNQQHGAHHRTSQNTTLAATQKELV
jgi:hypothetical protein